MGNINFPKLREMFQDSPESKKVRLECPDGTVYVGEIRMVTESKDDEPFHWDFELFNLVKERQSE